MRVQDFCIFSLYQWIHLPIWNASSFTHYFYNIIFGQNKTEEPAVFIDSNLIAKCIEYINPNEIESVNVIKKDTIINAVFFCFMVSFTLPQN
jgi:hypothetical protein